MKMTGHFIWTTVDCIVHFVLVISLNILESLFTDEIPFSPDNPYPMTYFDITSEDQFWMVSVSLVAYYSKFVVGEWNFDTKFISR